jgi:O-antigen/teichoic acid export membrane protein
MSLKHNILANFVGQIYIVLISIVTMPLYLKYMGAEAYGLIGFFSMLQMIFSLLDVGLSSTIARETARYHGGASDVVEYRKLVRALQVIFLVIALLGGIALLLSVNGIASTWLKVQMLPLDEVRFSLQIMAFSIALRWMIGLYRGIITGAERLVWLGNYFVITSTLRFVGVLPVLIFIGATPTIFFTYQLAVALVEFVGIAAKGYGVLPSLPKGQHLGWSLGPIKPVLKLSLTMALTSTVSVFVTQTDKLLLSNLLTLSDYGYFTLAVLMAGGITIISSPISAATMPRMAKLEAQGERVELVTLYRNITQLVVAIAISATLMLAFFSEQVLWAWAGDIRVAHKSASVLMLYALGNGLFTLSMLPYLLQFAKGDLKLHLAGNVLLVLLLIPALIWGTGKYGAVGAGYAWLAVNILYFVLWVPRIHRKFEKGLHMKWLLNDVGIIAIVLIFCAILIDRLVIWPQSRVYVGLYIVIFSLILLMIASAASEWVRKTFWKRWFNKFFISIA